MIPSMAIPVKILKASVEIMKKNAITITKLTRLGHVKLVMPMS